MRRLVVAALAALMLGIPGAGILSGLAWASPEDSATSAAAAPSTVTITDLPAVLEPGDNLVVSVDVTNAGDEPLELTSVDLRAQSTTSISEFALHRWMSDLTPSTPVTRATISRSLAPGQTSTLRLSFPDAELPWPTGEFNWGPRGIEIAVNTDAGTIGADRTMIVVASAADVTPYPTTAVVPISALTSEPVNRLLDDRARADGAAPDNPAQPAEPTQPDISKRVSAWDIAGVTLAVDRKLEASPRHATRAALPSYDADITALRALGLADQARRLGENAVFLPASPPAEEDITFAQSLGMTVLIPDADYAPFSVLTYTPSAVTTFNEETVLATNSTISTTLEGRLSVPGREDIALDDLDMRQVAVALSAVHQRQRPNDPRPYVIAVPRAANDAAREAVSAVLRANWTTASSVSTLLGLIPDGTERVLSTPAAATAGTLTQNDAAAIDSSLAAFCAVAAIFDDADAKIAAATAGADQLTSVSWREDPAGRGAQIRAIAPTKEQLESIHVTTTSTINLISESSSLPVQVTNDFDQPVTVTVHLDVPDIRLRAPAPVEVTLPASSTTTVSVPVEAHGSGNLDVEVTVTNAQGTLVGAADVLRVRVRADWENVGTVVVAGFVGLIFVIGLVKSVRDGRRSKPVPPDDFVAAAKRS